MTNNLKPCPFCGHKAVLQHSGLVKKDTTLQILAAIIALLGRLNVHIVERLKDLSEQTIYSASMAN